MIDTLAFHQALRRKFSATFVLVVVACLSDVCLADNGDKAITKLIARHGLTGAPMAGRRVPSISDPIARLGRELFYSPILSGTLDASCGTCHNPLRGGGDALPLSVGVDPLDPSIEGPLRRPRGGEALVPRNAPTTFNVALWDSFLFYDGRVESLGKTPGAGGADSRGIRTPDVPYGAADPNAGADLVAAQARFPVVNAEEMRGLARHLRGADSEVVRQSIVTRLLSEAGWRARFNAVFGAGPIEYHHVARALSAFQRTQVFVDNPWFRYIKGDHKALSEKAKRGALTFYKDIKEGGANCVACHRGDRFTDEQFHILAVPQVGPGKYERGRGFEDHGRYTEEPREGLMYAFRTPMLLNVAVSAPYGHSGVFKTLDEIIRHHLSPEESLRTFSPRDLPSSIQSESWRANTMKAITQLRWAQARGQSPLIEVKLSEQKIAELVEFLRHLTDPCVTSEACLAPWLPAATSPR